MITLKFTQSLLKDMKIKPTGEETVDSFWSWHVNIFYSNSRKHILFVNDLSRLYVIIDGIRTAQLKLLKEKFIKTLETYLIYEEIPSTQIEKYLKHGMDICTTKTNNRSVLWTMKEITIFNFDDFDDNLDRLKWINRLIHKPIDYQYPIEVFKNRLKQLK